MHISDNNQTLLTGEVSAISIEGIQAAENVPAHRLPVRCCTHMGPPAEGPGRAGSCCLADRCPSVCLRGKKLRREPTLVYHCPKEDWLSRTSNGTGEHLGSL